MRSALGDTSRTCGTDTPSLSTARSAPCACAAASRQASAADPEGFPRVSTAQPCGTTMGARTCGATASWRHEDLVTRGPHGGPLFGDCSKDTGFIQPVHDEAMPGFVVGLRRGLRAPCPVPSARGSVLVYVPGRPVFASCDSADCPVPPHATSLAVASHRELAGLCPTWEHRASSVRH